MLSYGRLARWRLLVKPSDWYRVVSAARQHLPRFTYSGDLEGLISVAYSNLEIRNPL